MTGQGVKLAEGRVSSSSKMTGDAKPGCFGVGEVSHMLGNVSTSAQERSTKLMEVLSGRGRGDVGSFA